MNRSNQLTVLAQICTDNNVTPLQGNYAGLIRKICATHLYVSEAKTKELTRSLTTAFFTDHWSSLLNPQDQQEMCGYELNKIQLQPTTPQEPIPVACITPTTSSTQDRASIHETMQTLTQNNHPEPVKKLEPQQSTQQDNLTEKQIAQILYGIAQRDTFNGVGRIILNDAREVTDNKYLQLQELLQFWQKHYPILEAETKSNVLLIYWDGKDNRQTAPYIQPKAPIFNPKKQEQGDIYEDTEGVVPEQENL